MLRIACAARITRLRTLSAPAVSVAVRFNSSSTPKLPSQPSPSPKSSPFARVPPGSNDPPQQHQKPQRQLKSNRENVGATWKERTAGWRQEQSENKNRVQRQRFSGDDKRRGQKYKPTGPRGGRQNSRDNEGARNARVKVPEEEVVLGKSFLSTKEAVEWLLTKEQANDYSQYVREDKYLAVINKLFATVKKDGFVKLDPTVGEDADLLTRLSSMSLHSLPGSPEWMNSDKIREYNLARFTNFELVIVDYILNRQDSHGGAVWEGYDLWYEEVVEKLAASKTKDSSATTKDPILLDDTDGDKTKLVNNTNFDLSEFDEYELKVIDYINKLEEGQNNEMPADITEEEYELVARRLIMQRTPDIKDHVDLTNFNEREVEVAADIFRDCLSGRPFMEAYSNEEYKAVCRKLSAAPADDLAHAILPGALPELEITQDEESEDEKAVSAYSSRPLDSVMLCIKKFQDMYRAIENTHLLDASFDLSVLSEEELNNLTKLGGCDYDEVDEKGWEDPNFDYFRGLPAWCRAACEEAEARSNAMSESKKERHYEELSAQEFEDNAEVNDEPEVAFIDRDDPTLDEFAARVTGSEQIASASAEERLSGYNRVIDSAPAFITKSEILADLPVGFMSVNPRVPKPTPEEIVAEYTVTQRAVAHDQDLRQDELTGDYARWSTVEKQPYAKTLSKNNTMPPVVKEQIDKMLQQYMK
ncbi:uncharacterized protein V1518DRAFT_239108 [Limtongia smithiae]|uniref:uncharacterized protein n=1 Tax=Limtongia smithiae TaxID=1125753 RepID=UPI0034CE90FE